MAGRAALLLLALQLILLSRTAWDKSDTADEPTYITSAALLGSHGDYIFNPEALALPKWGFAASMALFGGEVAAVPRHAAQAANMILWSKPPEGIRKALFRARAATIAAVLAGGFLLGLAAGVFSTVGAGSSRKRSGHSRRRSLAMVPSPHTTRGRQRPAAACCSHSCGTRGSRRGGARPASVWRLGSGSRASRRWCSPCRVRRQRSS